MLVEHGDVYLQINLLYLLVHNSYEDIDFHFVYFILISFTEFIGSFGSAALGSRTGEGTMLLIFLPGVKVLLAVNSSTDIPVKEVRDFFFFRKVAD